MTITISPSSSKEEQERSCPIRLDKNGELYIPLPTHPNLRITPWKEDDLDDIVELFNQPNVGKYGNRRPFPFTKEDASEILTEIQDNKSYLAQLSSIIPKAPTVPPILLSSTDNSPSESDWFHPPGKYGPVGALKDTSINGGKVIGTLNVKPSFYSPGDWDIAYTLSDSYTGNGIGTEMVKVGIGYGKWLGLRRVVAFTEADNLPSNSVLRKNGFNLESEHIIDWPEHRGGGKKHVYAWDLYL